MGFDLELSSDGGGGLLTVAVVPTKLSRGRSGAEFDRARDFGGGGASGDW